MLFSKAAPLDAGVEQEANIMGIMAPIVTVAGIALGSAVIEKAMEVMGHGDKVVFVKIISWVAAAGFTLNFWWDGVKHVVQSFGVY